MQTTSIEPSQPDTPPSRWRTIGLVLLEVFLVLLIVGLLCAMWLPAYIGSPPDPTPQ
jgi:type II secretory pathway pseudopilin PulG